MKKQVIITLLAVLMVSILPGCGKSKNKDGGIIGGPVDIPPVPPVTPIPPVTPTPTTPGLLGSCYNVSSINGGVTLGFYGNLNGTSVNYPYSGYQMYGYTSTTGITAQLGLSSTSAGIPSGYTNTYWRDNFIYGQIGDSVDLAIASNGTVYAQVSLSQYSISWIKANSYYGQASICSFELNVGILGTPITGNQYAWNGNIGGGPIRIVTGSGAKLQL